MTTKAAVVGFGRMGILHACIVNTMPEVELVAVCERSGILRRYGARALDHVQWVADVNELSEVAPDVIWVTTPTSSHYEVVKSICGFHSAPCIFVEKPLALTYDQTRELCELVDSIGNVNMVGYSRRFISTFSKAQDMLRHGDLGEVLSFEAFAFSSDGIGEDLGWRGGVLRDLGCHALDLVLWFFGSLRVSRATLRGYGRRGKMEDEAFLELVVRDSIRGKLTASWCMPRYRLPEIGIQIAGARGRMRVTDYELKIEADGRGSRIYYKHNLGDHAPFLLGGAEYYREDRAFLNAIRNRARAEPDFRDSLDVQKLIDDALELGNQPKHDKVRA